jgi:hypothetical protein
VRSRTAAVTTLAVLFGLAPAARAGDPIMPLSQVRAGMKCKAYTVVRGFDITSFDAEVVDIVDNRPYAPSILVRVSGPAVDDGGIAAGFSGSPVYCKDDQGTDRVAGAIAAVVGDFGNKLGVATGIEEILGESPDPPSSRARRARPYPKVVGGRRTHDAAGPLTVAGLSAPLERAIARTAARGNRRVFASPPLSAAQAPGAPPLRPGSSVSAGLSSGDLWIGGIGTVAYTDGNAAWLFGHPFEAVGRRSLLLQDAYVYTVVPNPNPEIGGYKLATPTRDIGTVTNDALAAVVGRTGSLPPTTEVVVNARDLDRGVTERTNVSVADESGVDLPAGISPLSFVAPLTVADASVRVLRSVPARQTGSACHRIDLAAQAEPLRFCNRYVTVFGGGVGGSIADDLAQAIALIDDVDFTPLRIDRVETALDAQRGAKQAFMLGATLPRRVRRGSTVTVSLRARLVRGPVRRFTFRLRIPRSLPLGVQELRLGGTDTDDGSELGGSLEDIVILDGGSGSDEAPEEGPIRTLAELRDRVAALERYDGIRARFGSDDEDQTFRVFRDPSTRIGGRLTLRVRVVR